MPEEKLTGPRSQPSEDHSEYTGNTPALSGDSARRVSHYQTAGANARLRLFALLETQGVPASEADDLVAALEAGAVASAQSEVVELDGMAWDEGVIAVSEARVQIADRDWEGRGGRSAGAAELAVHVADARRRERFGLETVLPRTYPNTMGRRRVLEVLGEAVSAAGGEAGR